MLKWRKSVLFNKPLYTFLNVILLFVHCSYELLKALFLIVHLRLSTLTSLLNDEHSCQRFKYNFTKNSRSNTDSVSKLFYNLVALSPFPMKILPALLVILFIMKLYDRGYLNVAATYFTFPKSLVKWSKCTHVLKHSSLILAYNIFLWDSNIFKFVVLL